MVRRMPPDASENVELTIPARDGYRLAATMFRPVKARGRLVVINSATAVPRRFYRSFAQRLANAGYTVLTYDYRGIGGSRPKHLRGFPATACDWALLDMAGVVDWVALELAPDRLFFVGHSLGGQVAGLLDNGSRIDGMVTCSAQSGHWRLQGGEQKVVVWLHVHVTLPLLSMVCGYMPFSWLGGGEDLPRAAALQWARWCRDPDYLLGDQTLPLERYASFRAPVLAYSFGDDKWGTARSVDAMMRAYPLVERRHVEPASVGLVSIGHLGYFRPEAALLWDEAVAWLDRL
jgi:predicted alpha/beta hydrolase